MALPKRKISKCRHGNKRSHQAYSLPNLSTCSQCHSPKPSHQVCPACGHYGVREVYAVGKSKE